MRLTGRRRWSLGVVATCVALSLTGCHTEYHGYDSGIDGTLWRQIASFEDSLSSSLFEPSAYEPIGYLNSVPGERWSGSLDSASDLDLEEGGVVLYDLTSTGNTAGLSVFISSGPRPDVPTDWGRDYDGPSQVFTCYRMEGEFAPGAMPSVGRTTLDHCPPALVELIPDDAAFASGEVFDG